MKTFTLTIFTLCLASISSAFDFSSIQNWTGTGTNESAVVIDWVDGSTTPAFAWGYRWSGAATGEDMLKAIVASDSNLTMAIQSYSFGDAVNEFKYNGANFGLGVHDQNGFGVNSTGYWGYYTGSGTSMPTDSTWVSASNGFGATSLSNQSWDGWSWQPNFNGVPPTQNVIAAPQAVPAPAGLISLGLGGLLLLRKRR